MQAIHDIFSIWPSISAMADAINEKPDTVLRWKLRGRIPEHVWPKVIERSAAINQPVTADELLLLNKPMGRRGRPPIPPRRLRKVVRLPTKAARP